jgi:putative membrane protein
MMGIQMSNVVNAILYSAIGIVIFALAFLVLDRVTPYNLWKEVIQEHNTALAILLGAMSLGICVIIAAAVH